MKLKEALETLQLHAQDYAAPRDLCEAVEAVTNYFDNHPVVDAADFFAAMERFNARAEAMRAQREG